MTRMTIMNTFKPRAPAILGIVDAPPTVASKALPIAPTVSSDVMDAYGSFPLFYRDGLRAVPAVLVDVRFAENVGLHVGLYQITGHYPRDNEYFVWLWHNGTMKELEQKNVRDESGVREVHLQAMEASAPRIAYKSY